MTRRIDIVEVGPRDGLQNDPADLNVDQKLEFMTERFPLKGFPVAHTCFFRVDLPDYDDLDTMKKRK